MQTTKKTSLIPLFTIMLITLSMRAPMGSVGPLVADVQQALGLSSFIAGFLTTIPLIAFAITAPLAGKIAVKIDNGVLQIGCLLLSALGMALRSYCGVWGLFWGTALLGVGIGTLNVTIPALLRKYYPERLGLVTGIYTTVISISSGLAAGTCVQIADAFGGWQMGLFAPIFLMALAVLVCVLTAKQFRGRLALAKGEKVRRLTWKNVSIAVFLGLQSFLFFSILTWFPSIVNSQSGGQVNPGMLLMLLQLCCLVPSLTMPVIAQRMQRRGVLACCCALLFTLGFVLLQLAGGNATLLLIASVVLGLGTGATISLANMFIAMRGANPAQTAQIAAFIQCLSYVLASFGPTALGFAHDAFSGWTVPVYGLVVVSGIMAVMGLFAGAKDEKN